MAKQLLSVVLVLAVVSQGVAHADEAEPAGVTEVADRSGLAVHIDALEKGDRVAVATDEGIVSGEVVDKDADDLVIDQPLIQGGAERVTIPRHEIQGVGYQSALPPQLRPGARAWMMTVVVVGALIGIAAVLTRGLGGP